MLNLGFLHERWRHEGARRGRESAASVMGGTLGVPLVYAEERKPFCQGPWARSLCRMICPRREAGIKAP